MSSPYTNPYAPPQSAEVYSPRGAVTGETGMVPDVIVEHMRGTRPWVIFLAILGFLASGLIVLAGFGVMAMGAVAKGASGTFPTVGMGFAYIVFGGIYVLPSVGLMRYGSSIADLVREPRMEQLAVALDRQRWFWKAVGIMAVVVLALYAVVFVVALVAFAAKGLR